MPAHPPPRVAHHTRPCSCAVACLAQFWPKKYPANFWLLASCVAAYVVLSSLMTRARVVPVCSWGRLLLGAVHRSLACQGGRAKHCCSSLFSDLCPWLPACL